MTRLTQNRLKELLLYTPKTGVFVWRVNRGGSALSGTIAGAKGLYGYRQIKVDRKKYYSHRLAWLYVFGESPDGDIDHINNERADDRISNLRACTRSENNKNARVRVDNISGYKGVNRKKDSKTNLWRARIRVDGKLKNLGTYPTVRLAHEAYCRAADKYHGEFANYGNKENAHE